MQILIILFNLAWSLTCIFAAILDGPLTAQGLPAQTPRQKRHTDQLEELMRQQGVVLSDAERRELFAKFR